MHAAAALAELVFHGGEKALAIANADGYFLICDLDLALADVLDLTDRDDVRTVCPDELAGGKFLCDRL